MWGRRAVLVAIFLLASALGGADADLTEPLVVQRGEFVRVLTLTGELEATQQVSVVTPRISRSHNHVISYLAPEGSLVSEGEILVEFDVSELEGRRLELEKKREDARIQIAQTRARQETQRQDLLLNLASAVKQRKVAELYLGIDASLIPAADAEKYAFEHEKAVIEMEKIQERLETLEQTGRAEMEVVQLDFRRADLDLKRVVSEIEKMTVRAPIPGLVIYGDNPTRSGKIQVGDSLWTGWAVVRLPNMSSLRVKGYLYDSDLPFLEGGERAEISLDAFPDRRFPGVVTSISETSSPRTFRSQLRAFVVEVILEEIDPERMKPGMTARVRIPVAKQDALFVSRDAVFAEGGETVVLRRTELGDERIPVEVVDAGETHLMIAPGVVEEGDRLVRRPAGSRDSSQEQVEWFSVQRDDLVFFVSGSGTLEAERAVTIGPPPIADAWRFKIVSLVPEGVQVRPGDLLIGFDPSDTHKNLREEQANLDKVKEELEKTEASERIKVVDLELQLEEARAQDEKARNKLLQAREFESNLKVKEAEFEAELSAARVEHLGRKLSLVRESVDLQLQILKDRVELHEHRINRNLNALESLNVLAPIGGVVIYETNWRNEKKQVGSEVFRMEKVLALPDLDTLLVRGQVGEIDAGKIALGQEVRLTLDAFPDRIFSGRIKQIGNVFEYASFDRPVKVLGLTVELNEKDPRLMRPGMVARLQIVTRRFSDVLAVPLASIDSEAGESYVWVKQGEEIERRKVELGEDNGIVAVVESGLSAGEQVAERPLRGSR